MESYVSYGINDCEGAVFTMSKSAPYDADFRFLLDLDEGGL